MFSAEWFSSVMGRKQDLTEREKGQIQALAELGLSPTAIAAKLGRARTTIVRFQDPNYARTSRSRCGRKSILTLRDRRHIINLAVNHGMSSGKIKDVLNLRANRSTVYRVLQAKKNLKFAKRKRQPNLNEKHMAIRREFARKCQTWDKEC